jgi:hypothetical protein
LACLGTGSTFGADSHGLTSPIDKLALIDASGERGDRAERQELANQPAGHHIADYGKTQTFLAHFTSNGWIEGTDITARPHPVFIGKEMSRGGILPRAGRLALHIDQ